ncbi:hypothetical protein PR202_gb18986 [Eleusine coracana subsp. coracana]|uniref:Uncharacterized protein n=1 Tax=Eleusine coracana subsp. coracana TaxID=191504 RepID=A0AAV5F8T6_ELECO|nr:hypothetical protein PR202_gb18986 [Eleusine coracana subsp. coracana]
MIKPGCLAFRIKRVEGVGWLSSLISFLRPCCLVSSPAKPQARGSTSGMRRARRRRTSPLLCSAPAPRPVHALAARLTHGADRAPSFPGSATSWPVRFMR